MDDGFVESFNNPPHNHDEYVKYYRDLFYTWRTPGQCLKRWATLPLMDLNVLSKSYLAQFLLVDDEIAIFSKYFSMFTELDDELLLQKLGDRPACAYYYCINRITTYRPIQDAALHYIIQHRLEYSRTLLESFWNRCTPDSKLRMIGTTPFLLRSKTFRRFNVSHNSDFNDDGIAGLLYSGRKINLSSCSTYAKFLCNVVHIYNLLQTTQMPHVDQDEYYDVPEREAFVTICFANIIHIPDPARQRSAWNMSNNTILQFFQTLSWNKIKTDKQLVLPYSDINYQFMIINQHFLGMEHYDRELIELKEHKIYEKRELRLDVDMWSTIISDSRTGSQRAMLVSHAIKELCVLIALDLFTNDFQELIKGIYKTHKEVIHRLPLAQALHNTNCYSALSLSLAHDIYTINRDHISLLPSDVRYALINENNKHFITASELDRAVMDSRNDILNWAPVEIMAYWAQSRDQILLEECTHVFRSWQEANCTVDELILLIEELGIEYMNTHLDKFLNIIEKIPNSNMINKSLNITKIFRRFDALSMILACPWSVTINPESFYQILLLEKYDIVNKLCTSMRNAEITMTIPDDTPINVVTDLVKNNVITIESVPSGMKIYLEKCSICLRYLDDNTNTLACTHVFHRNCLHTWICSSTNYDRDDIMNVDFLQAKCPLCRSKIYN